jgi:hypothetical protein
MKRIRCGRSILRGAAGLVLVAAIFASANGFAVAAGAAAPAGAGGVQWRDITLQQALAEAREKNLMVMVDVWDSHCAACGQLDADVFQTPDGVTLADDHIPIKIQTTVEAGRQFMQLYPVTGLPAVIFLKPDGTELDRVEGYFGQRNVFLDAARPLSNGIDPLERMEKRLQARPDSLPLLIGVLEKYLWRKRDTEAQKVYQRILTLDPQNGMRTAERAMGMMARYEENYKNDYGKAAGYYEAIVEKFPNSMSAGGIADAAFKALYRGGRSAEWKDWICPLLDKNPANASLQRSVAITALNWSQRGACFAKAARTAARLNAGGRPAFYDSIAVIFEGGTPPGK